MSGLGLDHPLWFAVALAALLVAHGRGGRRGDGPVAWHPWPKLLEGLPRGARQVAAPWLARGRLLLCAGFAAGLSGPTSRFETRREVRRGLDVAVVLDASSSMTVAVPGSYAATRFVAAREAAAAFVAGRPEDRVGLTLFAKWPRMLCPLTADHALFAARLGAAQPVASGSEEDGTAIGVALAAGAQQLGPKATRERLLVLVTDGANNLGAIAPEDGARLCRDQSIRVYTIALGLDAPFGTGTAPADTELLNAIASATGGRSFAASDAAGLADAWRAIDGLERAPLEVVVEARAESLAAPFVAWLFVAWCALALIDRCVLRSVP